LGVVLWEGTGAGGFAPAPLLFLYNRLILGKNAGFVENSIFFAFF